MFPKRVQLWLYRWALDRGHLDTILDRFVIHPLMRLSRFFARLDGMGLHRPPGRPKVPVAERQCRQARRVSYDPQRRFSPPWRSRFPGLPPFWLAVTRRQLRVIGFAAALVSVVASALLLHAAPASESLNEALMVLFSCLTLGATLVLPRRDCTSGTIGGILFLLGSTLLAYSTDDLRILLAAWVTSTVPFFFQNSGWARAHGARGMALLLSSAALALAVALIARRGLTMSIGGLARSSPGGMAVFGLLVAAVIFRKGICPAHAWVADAAEEGALIPTALLLNGHFGAMLVARLIVPLFPYTARDLFPVLSYLALATALYVAIRALTENSPRRLLAFLALSQSACILAGWRAGPWKESPARWCTGSW